VNDAPGDPLPPDVQALENEVLEHPDSEWHHVKLLRAFCSENLYGHPRRIEAILDFIARFPRSIHASSPWVQVDSTAAPEDFASIEALWSRLRSEHLGDPDLAIGHAALVATHDQGRSADILRASISLLPENAALWTELGRVAPESSDQLDALSPPA
jgi:hypothetical protein